MKQFLCIWLFMVTVVPVLAQSPMIDHRLQPLLDEFFSECDSYDIEYRIKLTQLESVDIVNSLPLSENNATLGMLRRDDNDNVVAIEISWMAQIDPEILKVIAFHEFAHYFLEYSTHVCDDCGKIMAVVNTSYFEVANDWDNQLRILFEESPVVQRKFQGSIANSGDEAP